MAIKTKGLGDLLAGNIIFRSLNIACTVLITFLLTRAMGAESFGLLSLMIANAALLNLLTCLGAESGITYHYSSGSLSRPSLITIAYIVIVFQMLVLLAVEELYYHFTGHFFLGERERGYGLLIGGFLYFLSVVTIDKYQAFFNASHRYNEPVRIMVMVNLLSLVVYGYYYFAVTDTPRETFVLIFIVSSVLQALIMVWRFHHSLEQPLKLTAVRRNDWKQFFSYSSVVLITNIIQFLAYRIDYWLIDHYKGAEQLGFYSLAVRLGQMLWILPLLMAGILFPRIAGEAGEEEEEKWLSLVRITNMLFLLAAVGAALLSPVVIPFFAGAEFSQSVVPFIYLLPGLLFFCFNIVFAAWFAGKGMLKVNLIGSTVCLLAVLAGDLLLIPQFGIKGAAMASSIGYTVAGVHHLWQFAYHKKKNILSVVVMNRGDWHHVKQYLRKYTVRK